jgi:hypothetical protein
MKIENGKNHGYCYQLIDGKVGKMPLDRWQVPEGLHIGIDGYVAPETIKMLSEASFMAKRIAPWITTYCVPKLLHTSVDGFPIYEVDGIKYNEVSGTAFINQNTTMLALTGPWSILQTQAHELMHHIFRMTFIEWQTYLRSVVYHGIWLPNAYYDDGEERICRWFQSWVMRKLSREDAQDFSSSKDIADVEAWFEYVYSGQFAIDALKEPKKNVTFLNMIKNKLGIKGV